MRVSLHTEANAAATLCACLQLVKAYLPMARCWVMVVHAWASTLEQKPYNPSVRACLVSLSHIRLMP